MRRIFLVASHPNLRDALAMTIQSQSRHTLHVVGSSCWDAREIAAIGRVQPDVVVLIVGIEAGSELRAVARIRTLAPGCRILIVNTLGDFAVWQSGAWGSADALLDSDQLATGLVPMIRRLVAQRDAPPSSTGAGRVPSTIQE